MTPGNPTTRTTDSARHTPWIRRTLAGASTLLAVFVVAFAGLYVVRLYRTHQFVAELVSTSTHEVRITRRHPEWFSRTVDAWNDVPIFLHGLDSVEDVTLVDSDDLSARLERLALLPELEALWIEGPVADPRAWNSLAHLTRLRTLDIRSPSFDGRAAAGIGRMTRLETLRIPVAVDEPTMGKPLTDADLESWSGLVELTEVDLSGHPITGRGLHALAGCRKLTKLNLTDCPIDDGGAAALAAMDALEELDLDGTQVTDAGLDFLGRLRSLRFLRLARTPVEGHGLTRLHADAPLELLDLADSPANDSVWKFVAQTPTLLCLDLRNTCVTGVGMDAVSTVKHPLRLEWIDLSGTLFGDSGVGHLRGLPRLAELSLSRTLVTGSGFRQIPAGVSVEARPPNFPALMRLSLRSSLLNDEGVVDLGLSALSTLRDLDVAETNITSIGLETFLKEQAGLERLDFSETSVIATGLDVEWRRRNEIEFVSPGWIDEDSSTSITWVGSPSTRWPGSEVSRMPIFFGCSGFVPHSP